MEDTLALLWNMIEADPNRIAVHDRTGEHTYGEFAGLIESVAGAVAKAGDHPKVLIYLPQEIGAYAAMFAAHQAGGYYGVINLEWPPNQQQRVFDLFKADAVVFDSSTVPLMESMAGSGVAVDLSNLPTDRLTSRRPAHDLAYVMFTSGSTGTPKGVMISSTGLANYVDWSIREMALTRNDRWSQHSNIAFDLSVLDVYGALCSGASLHPLTSLTERMFPARFVRQRQLTIWNSVPSVVDMMRASNEVTSDNLFSLRLLTFCGEPLLREHVRAIFNARPDVEIYNTYGPTEATVSCTLLRLNKEMYESASRGSIAFGEPIQNMGLHLIDGATPDEGEIVLSGSQLARGYWEAPELTAEAFMEVDIAGVPTPVYRTGDWGIREDGHNYFASRIDRQIKIRGHRVELNEIDKAARDAGVRSACTVFVDHALYCYVEGDGPVDLVLVRREMEKVLPHYAMPSSIQQLDKLPRNSNEKIDANLLIEMVKNEF